MHHLPFEILQLICIYTRDHDTNDLATLRRVSRSWLQASTPVLFETLTIILSNDGGTEQRLSDFHELGLGNLFLEHARTMDIVCVRDVSSFRGLRVGISRLLKTMQANLCGHIPPVAVPAFLEEYCLLGVTPTSDLHWVFDVFWMEEWEPLVTLISRMKCLTRFDSGLLNRFPRALHEALATYHPNCALNIWKGAIPLPGAPLDEQTALNSNPLKDPLHRMDDYSLANLQSYSALCPSDFNRVSPRMHWAYMMRHLHHLAACRKLRYLDIQPDSCWSTYNEICRRNEEWPNNTPTEAIANLEALTISSSGPREEILLGLTSVFDLSTLKSLDFEVFEHSDLLKKVAPRLRNLQRLFITVDTSLNRTPDLFADNQGVIEAVLAFRPLQYLCLRQVRNVTTVHTILEHHGLTLKGLQIEPIRTGRAGLADFHFKYPAMTATHVVRIAESAPHLRELRIPLKRTMGDENESAIYRAIGSSFRNLQSLLLDLHYDTRTPPLYPRWRPNATELHDILVNAATDKDLAQRIWTVISRNQATKTLRNLTVRPFGSEAFQMLEAYLLLTLGRTFLVTRGSSMDGSEPLHIKCVGEGVYELEVENRLLERGNPWRGLPPLLREVVDGVWPGTGEWQTRWKSFPLEEEEEEED
ncbi:hypothetical protein BJY01DRAFT_159922 [Aspergillus pseudoustus]|uniref:F-box domain-containing protein n=1 Tax=Aspergillus pseudoustus TaxID=1810923 RepID=A0ABR4K9D2_9EURO